ncbi:hypothetical protein [Parasitella parasitica]|uniref:Uncharacterized protein n=1 Tax=Parasitella parasitica TaxID=35722 RepID=A0A0B7MZR3_9FUNG|nr:hypothetical protein [Parasitella parasitica]
MNTSLSPPQCPSAKSNSSKHPKPSTTIAEKTPPRSKSNEDETATQSDEGSIMDLLEKDFKLTISDDLMTDDDSDIDEEQAALMGLAREPASSIHPYHIDAKENSSMCYHPTAAMIHENNQMMEQQQGTCDTIRLRLRPTTAHPATLKSLVCYLDNMESALEDDLYETRASFSRRPSQLIQERTTLNALCPPSHLLKARRLSKTIMKPSASTPITVKDKDRRSSISDSNHSAVSPRFMALRKLSEVSALPPHSISYSVVPPVPQISSASAAEKSAPRAAANEEQLLNKVDKMVESQLQFHLGQIVWRVSESHLDARRFWEEQKKEMFGLAATLIGQMDAQVVMQKRMAIESTKTTERIERGEANLALLQKELNTYISKYTEAKSQLFELEVLKARNLELEKQHKDDLKTITQLKKEQQQQKLDIKRDVGKDKPLADLKSQNVQLKTQVQHLQKTNQQLLEQAALHEQDKKKQTSEVEQLRNQVLQLKQCRLPALIAAGLDHSDNVSEKKLDNWADIMESEDKTKKSAVEWAQEYRELQARYFEACSMLQKKQQAKIDYKKKIYDLDQSAKEKDELIRHLKQAQDVDRIQLNYLQKELNNHQEKRKKNESSETGGYTTEGDFLTFTTEINGQPSKYTIKIPNVNRCGNKRCSKKQTYNNTSLNPYASEWRQTKAKN